MYLFFILETLTIKVQIIKRIGVLWKHPNSPPQFCFAWVMIIFAVLFQFSVCTAEIRIFRWIFAAIFVHDTHTQKF